MRHILLSVLLLCSCDEETPPPPPPPGIAPVQCFEQSKKLGRLNTDGRITLCSDAPDPTSRIDCYEKAKATLSVNGAIALCSPAMNLFLISERELAAKREATQNNQHSSVMTKLNQLATK